MVLDIVLGILLGAALAGLLGLVIRKLPIVRLTDPSRVAELKQSAVKQNLLEARLRRRLKDILQALIRRVAPLGRFYHYVLKSWTGRWQALEGKMEREVSERTSLKATQAELVAKAHSALEAEDFAQAEALYLKAVQRNPKAIELYEGLGRVYLAARDYEQAREVFEYLADKGDATVSQLGLARVASGQGNLEEAQAQYLKSLALTNAVQPHLELAHILSDLGKPAEAWEHVRAAKELEPNNPKILDFYIELSIVNGHPMEAQQALDALREVNPDNQKIPEFSRDIRRLALKLKAKTQKSVRRSSNFGLPT